ncbi:MULTISPECIES: phosphoribosylaminoimidazolesuccinocarboxamide synthase [Acidobacteriaceae]|uniref:phosphoribosylaminoimidazolesuccinocarboxamide synthase n=1 Tax=Acidobacteriaceae TaxID=204434 RepID=UPI00131D22F4|nr:MULTISPECIES: phosphoribosylaminoimidazolesuccinocarboxamide synthase [Acidobacteriaceae]MDW5266736.1 phosphoribosylaminoimidazolesuccinocarboxamide synthase [Edaphobacter sp.]
MSQALLQTSLGDLPLVARGKVRDIYDLGSQQLLFVATDRISAFDHVLATGITDKGRILTQLSLFWFDLLKDIVKNHLITADTTQFPSSCQPYLDQLTGRSMLVKRAEMFPVECVVRGYISGSGWKDYRQTGSICGIKLPTGLRESDKLPEPIFTPAAKNNVGHDENISFEKMVDTIGQKAAEDLRSLTLKIYEKASKHAASRGLILADTKFEFGLINGEITLADEVLTPDSSRYWPAETYNPGGAQPSFDKQYVRDYLESIHWNKQAPAPGLPPEVVEKTKAKYLEAFRLITGRADL